MSFQEPEKGGVEDAVCAQTVEELRSAVGEDGYLQIRAEFIASTERQLAAMSRFADSGDRDALRRAAHALKGAGGSLGARVLSELCQRLETRLAEGAERAALTELVARLTAEFVRVRTALSEGP